MATKPAEPDAPGIDLDQVCTTGDTAVWLRQQAARHTAEATTESSPAGARALRLAGSTLEVYATVVGTYRDPAGIGAELARHAADYRHPDRDAVEPIPDDYRLSCGHLAGVLDTLAQQLTRAAGPKQHQRHPVESCDRHIGL